MTPHPRVDRFVGRIAGVGSTSGTRVVVGMWSSSSLGPFVDVMVHTGAGHRVLLAPSAEVASYVSSTYEFDEVRVEPVAWRRVDGGLRVSSDSLSLTLVIGRISVLGRLLRVVPARLAVWPAWLRLINPVARVLVRGAATAGTAGGGRREYYGVTLARHVIGLSGSFDGAPLGRLAPLSPPVGFGFAQTPAAPTLVDVTTTIVFPPPVV